MVSRRTLAPSLELCLGKMIYMHVHNGMLIELLVVYTSNNHVVASSLYQSARFLPEIFIWGGRGCGTLTYSTTINIVKFCGF